jgi:hypothetical protein
MYSSGGISLALQEEPRAPRKRHCWHEAGRTTFCERWMVSESQEEPMRTAWQIDSQKGALHDDT